MGQEKIRHVCRRGWKCTCDACLSDFYRYIKVNVPLKLEVTRCITTRLHACIRFSHK